MKIRTVTVFGDMPGRVVESRVRAFGEIGRRLASALEAAGYDVQSVRLALGSVPELTGGDPSRLVASARELEMMCPASGIDYATLGVVCPHDPPGHGEAIADAIGATAIVFASMLVTDDQSLIRRRAVRTAASTIRRLSRVPPDGFGNLRFAALANVRPGVPFLPGAYSGGGPVSIAVGVEAAALAVEAASEAGTLDDARSSLVRLIEGHASRIGAAIAPVRPSQVRFRGIDFSLAPYPEVARSIGTAIERLSGVRVGEHGTLAATAWLATAVDQANVPRAGYSGVFLPVFEDSVIASRAIERLVSVNDLLLWSSVCGTGLDTVPLPGDVSDDTLSAILTDLAALALRLDKPLTARLMPIPGGKAGDPVSFDFPYFAPARVLEVRGSGLSGLLAGAEAVEIRPRTG